MSREHVDRWEVHDELDENNMQTYVATAPKHVVPLLILDNYHCHMMGSVIYMVQDFGVWVEHIPGGCTSLCQHIDAGFNKPFNNNIRKYLQQ